MELHCDVHPGNGPPLLLLHGLLSSGAQFEPNLEALSQVAKPVVVEMWGHGRSPVPEDPALFHPDAYVEAFERIRERLGVEAWMICGLSLGAALTLRYALDHPDRVTAQIFTNSTSALADAEWANRVRQIAAAQAQAIVKGGRQALEQMPIHPRHAKRLPEETKAALVRDAERLSPTAMARTMEFTVPESPLRDRVHGNTTPTLLVCGTREKRFHEYRAYAEREMPNLEIVEIPVGHAVNIEAAPAFNAAVTDFIARQAT